MTTRSKIEEWEVDNARRTLMEAAKIQKNPKMMAAIKRRDKKERQTMDEVLLKKEKSSTPKKKVIRKPTHKNMMGNQRYLG